MGLFKKQKTAAVAADSVLAPKKTATTIVVVVGAENAVYPFHIAHTLRNTKQADVVLIDNSVTQVLFDSVPKIDGVGNGFEISVVSNRMISPEAFQKFDYVVVYLGYTPDTSYLEIANSIIILSDYSRENRNFLTNFNAFGKPLQFIFFNRVTGRVTEKMMLESMRNVDIKSGAELQTLEFTEEDAVGYLSFQYDGFYPVSKMSKDYQNTMQTVIQKIAEPEIITEEEEPTENKEETT